MTDRVRLKPTAKNRANSGGNYFAAPKTNLKFISSGCLPLDLALGGGWARRRISNIVGDKSTGKTLLCIEACANFILSEPKARIFYRECESAFDKQYAAAIGFPVDKVAFDDSLETVEDVFEDLTNIIATAKWPSLYIVDSLDALTDRAEMARAIDAATFGAGKAKQLSQLFRRLIRQLATKDVTVIIVSQIRDKIGAMFGRKVTRTGGHALDFYASQVLFLSQLGTIKKTIRKIERPIALQVRGMVDKNKVGLAQRQANFQLHFGYGIDDAEACVTWLKDHNGLDLIHLPKTKVSDYLKELAGMNQQEHLHELADLHKAVSKLWYEVETDFLPKRTKYGQAFQ